MYFFKSRIRDSLRSLISKNYIQAAGLKQVMAKIGPDKIKTFIQIGSNDGMKNDPIREFILKYKWEGILVEPNTVSFNKLRMNYASEKGLIFENIGIAELSTTGMTFFYIGDVKPEEPEWYDQICSFDEATFLKNIACVPGLSERARTCQVPVLSFDDLIVKHNCMKFDLLHIDAEGYDFKILESIDMEKYNPKVIIFESEWLTAFEVRGLTNRFTSLGYEIFHDGFDHIAAKK